MSTLVSGSRNAFTWLSWGRVSIAAVVMFYLLVGASVVASASSSLGGFSLVTILAIALVPICIFLTFRYPLIFPFGLYILITPVDALLAATGAASLVKIIGAIAAGALLLRTILLRRALLPQRGWYFWLGFLAYATLTIAWAPDFVTGPGLNTYIPMVLLFVMMTVLAIYPAEKNEFKIMLGMIVLAGLGAAFYTISQYKPSTALDASRIALKALDSTSVEDPNYLGGAFFMPIAFALAGVFYAKNVAIRIISALSIPAMVGAVFTTASRSAFLGVAVIIGYFVVRSKYRIQALLVALAGFSLTVFFPTILGRLSAKDVGTADGRTDIWRTGMHSFGDHWLFGAGFGSYMYEYDRNLLNVYQETFAGWTRPGHSLIFVNLNDFGVVGLALVLICWFVSFRQLRAIDKDSWLFGVRLAIEASMIGLFIHFLFLDPTFVKYVWLAQSLPLLVLNLYAPRIRESGGRRLPFRRFRPAPVRGG